MTYINHTKKFQPKTERNKFTSHLTQSQCFQSSLDSKTEMRNWTIILCSVISPPVTRTRHVTCYLFFPFFEMRRENEKTVLNKILYCQPSAAAWKTELSDARVRPIKFCAQIKSSEYNLLSDFFFATIISAEHKTHETQRKYLDDSYAKTFAVKKSPAL